MKKELLALTFGTLITSVGCRDIERIEPPLGLEQLAELDRARVELGQRLFFDKALSRDGTISCASCHDPSAAGVDGAQVSIGIDGRRGRRNAPTVLNVGFKAHLFWDGRASTLEEQSLMPLRNPDEMGADDEDVLAYLRSDQRYVGSFAFAFPTLGITMDAVASALAAYQRQLVTPSRVDDYLGGDESALDAAEQRGLDFFRANCAFCHDGPGIGGQRLEKLGDQVPWPADRSQDLGRFEVTGDDGDRLVFAVPQLRNVARTAPYFHDGSVETLEEAVELMGRHQVGEELSEQTIQDVVAFLTALDAEPDPWLLSPPASHP